MSTILGISAFFHDSAATLIINGEIFAAAQEERFTRKKNDPSFPLNAIKYVLEEGKLNLEEVNYVVFYEKPFLKFERLLETYVANAPQGFQSFNTAIPIWIKEKLFQKSIILSELKKINKSFNSKKLLFSEHHESHAASAFYPSPFNEAVILTIDGVGEWATTTVSIGKKNNIEVVKEINYPHSLGLLYSAFTYYLGFKVNSGEYKVMGLAPYGIPKYKNKILENILDLKEDGSFYLDQSYFNYSTGLTMINKKFSNLFGQPIRNEDSKISQFHMDIASSIQAVIDEAVICIVKNIYQDYKIDNLCLAGGVALNCVTNSKILKLNKFKELWIQPAAGDAGGSLGAALLVWHKHLGKKRNINKNDMMKGAFLGPRYSNTNIKKELEKCGAKFDYFDENQILKKTAKYLADGKAIGWFKGKMEFGPRSLGARSIIADPRVKNMQKLLNLKIKFRESFRPFAPSILKEDLSKWFELKNESPYMLIVSDVHKNIRNELSINEKSLSGLSLLNISRSKIPAVTHVDFSARVQTVSKETNPYFYSLISEFKKITGCPVLLNTSFNIRGEPIICSPEDAFKCFMTTNLDFLVIENFILKKSDQNDHQIKVK